MHVTAFLADSAETVNGKIYAMGIGWDLLVSPTFPFAFPRVALGVMIHVEWTETDADHELRIHLETEDGDLIPMTQPDPRDPEQRVTAEWGTTFSVGRPPALSPGSEQIVPFSLNVNDLAFPAPGGYSWVIMIDGEVAARLPLKVAVAPSAV